MIIEPHLLRAKASLARAYYTGEWVYQQISIHTGFDPKSNVLDVGCGDGRVSAAFARHDFNGRYFSFDINIERVDALQRLFKEKDNFEFKHSNIFHTYYNSQGKQNAEQYKFEYSDGVMDLAFLNSICTHMKFSVITNYLKECYRVTALGGKMWVTFYVIDELVGEASNSPKRKFSAPYEEGFTATPENPEGCVGFEKNKIIELFDNTGFTILKYIPGYWKTERSTLDQHEQDVFVLEKQT